MWAVTTVSGGAPPGPVRSAKYQLNTNPPWVPTTSTRSVGGSQQATAGSGRAGESAGDVDGQFAAQHRTAVQVEHQQGLPGGDRGAESSGGVPRHQVGDTAGRARGRADRAAAVIVRV